ncbi:Demethylrebeccamycin-D-glucose O-methyltransferase [Rosistilla carotiformis]|uniref:Demethylrebeccamycin-D-glucose O-methyltransferase n=1 Tax=Rosistilla carotiformis TaxID=2528017 RepID=A0A518K198_9BACT|nr:class I SAM-dependent methyltransferase [Rosistilla carotiformis]QDV71566.1 Demethylrebeccamycin-D-glucose O-methyltransferase [Rosistilla carotiformis]
MNASESPNPPYFDVLFDRIASGDHEAVTAFGRHVHWGLWESNAADGTAADYLQAAERMCQRICDAAKIQPPARIADVGCGFGGTIASLNERYQSLAMTGINIDSRQLQRAEELVVPAAGNQIQWICADAASLPLDDAGFDAVLAVECIFHFDRPRFFAEASRVLRPGGVLSLSDFVPQPRMAAFMDGGAGPMSEAIQWTYGDVDMSCSLEGYEQLAAEHGMRLLVCDDVTEQTLPTYDFLCEGARRWHDQKHAELFLQATGWLQKASRKKMIRYLILSFEKLASRAG